MMPLLESITIKNGGFQGTVMFIAFSKSSFSMVYTSK
jgi:hypothetical protein